MLKFSNVSANYANHKILNNINISFPCGQITTIIGPNGCGKSTLVKCINGQIDSMEGSILLNDIPLNSLTTTERAKKIAVLPQIRQTPSILSKTLVEHGRFPHQGFLRRQNDTDRGIVEASMKFTKTEGYAKCYVDSLSGGERQRVFFAMNLAQDCEYIILDEPTTYLDISHQFEFLKLLTKLKEEGKTIILVLHDIAQALQISDSVVLMKSGKVISHSTPSEYLRNHLIEEVFNVNLKIFEEDGKLYTFFY